MLAFAGNSLLCRLALTTTAIDPASFTSVRIASGAATLALLTCFSRDVKTLAGNWPSAMALFIYAAGFSFAYISLSAATGALLLFGAVQCTMIGYGFYKGERINRLQVFGLVVALLGLVGLLLPGLSAPPLAGAVLMFGAGVAWGVYSLRGRGVANPTTETAGNFVRAVPLALAVSAIWFQDFAYNWSGIVYGVVSGALASGVGYAFWYTALRSLTATTAATVQLSVPALAAVGGVIFLSEAVSARLALASLAILGGVFVYLLAKERVLVGP